MIVERMIELLEIEKECVLRNAIGKCNRYCAGCDLLQDDTELHEMYTEAIALLKAQEPRLITEADFENADAYGYLPVWVEDKDDNEIICDCITKHAITEPDEDYHYRYWTSRPTDEQREATPWLT